MKTEMKTAILVVTVIGMPFLLAAGLASAGLASADDIHCWLHQLGILQETTG